MAIQIRSVITKTYYRASHAVLRAFLFQLATVPGIWAALALYGLLPGNITAFAATVILSMLVAMFNAWVLLVEIQRDGTLCLIHDAMGHRLANDCAPSTRSMPQVSPCSLSSA